MGIPKQKALIFNFTPICNVSKGNAENREYLWTSAIYFGKNIYKAENVWYTSIVLITYQEQLGYYKKVENRKALTTSFLEVVIFLWGVIKELYL